MKWFKHSGNARSDEKIEKLLMKYGVEGYGLYFYCVEIIAGNLSTDNITFDLKHDAETIAYRLKMDTLKVEEIMKWMVAQGLFQFNDTTGRVMCLGLLKRLDVSTSNNPELKKMVKNSHELLETNSNYQKLLAPNSRREENRKEETRKEEKREPPPKKVLHELTGKMVNETRYLSLTTDYGKSTVDDYIQRVIDYEQAKGKQYRDYAAAAANWIKRDGVKKLQKEKNDDEPILKRV